MKIQPDHAATIAAAAKAHDTPEARKVAIQQGYTDRRHRWDCLWVAKQSSWVCDTLYPYLNDDHIDSALRSIIPELDRSTLNQGA